MLPPSFSKMAEVAAHPTLRMNHERTIAEIEWLERLYSLPDTRPLQLTDLYAANQRHDEIYANNPWFRLWKRYGV